MDDEPLEGSAFDQQSSIAAKVDALAVRARGGDAEARDRLYELLAPRIRRFTNRWRGRHLPDGYDMDDLHQEAYLAFAALLQEWCHDRSFYPYFLKVFPRRLRRTVWQLSRCWRKVEVAYVDHHELVEMLDSMPSSSSSDEGEEGDLEAEEL
ncbi:MAG: sigma-70 family RNA polymerase sigma factor, partial [Chloroflexi bacterium]|nr:sigma-70 family RNA polymerase sigma factor [Chloroflexota bacterium]